MASKDAPPDVGVVVRQLREEARDCRAQLNTRIADNQKLCEKVMSQGVELSNLKAEFGMQKIELECLRTKCISVEGLTTQLEAQRGENWDLRAQVGDLKMKLDRQSEELRMLKSTTPSSAD